jgi:precorrin-3B methylase
MDELEVDMETVVIVGSSRTVRRGEWLVSLRDEAPP